MIKLRKRALTLLAALIILLIYSGCAQTHNSDGYRAKTIKIHYSSSFSTPATQLLMLTGLLEDTLPDDVTVEWVNITSSSNVRDAVVAGKLDIGFIAVPTAISALENDFPLVILSGSVVQAGIIYSSRPDIRTLDDIGITDKIAIISKGNTGHLALMLISKEKYGDAQKFDSNIVTMQHADMLATVKSSDMLDCIILGFPNTLRADEIEKLSPIYDLAPISIENSLGHLAVSNDEFCKNNPALVEAFNISFRQTVDFMKEQPEEAGRILTEIYSDTDAQDIGEYIKKEPPSLEISESAYDKVADLMYEVGMLDHAPKKFSELPNYESIPKIP